MHRHRAHRIDRRLGDRDSGGLRVAGPLLRATSIDFANNLYYACLIDEASQQIYLGRYDVETAQGSGQTFTHCQDADLPTAGQSLQVVMCAIGSAITCDVPAAGIHLTASDGRYSQGEPGFRVMLADVDIEDVVIMQP